MMAYSPKRGPLAGKDFPNEGQYRKALAAFRGDKSHRAMLNRQAQEKGHANRNARLSTPTTTPSFHGLTPVQAKAKTRAARAAGMMRRDPKLTVAQAARKTGASTTAISKYGGVEKTDRGRWIVKPRTSTRASDLIAFVVLTPNGQRDALLTEVEASTAGSHWNHVKAYRRDGVERRLIQFRGVRVGGFELVSDPTVLQFLIDIGAADLDTPYDQAAA